MKEYKYPAEYAREKLKFTRPAFYSIIGRGYVRAEGSVSDRWVYLPFELVPGEEYYTTPEAADMLGYVRMYISHACAGKASLSFRINAVKFGGDYRIPGSEIKRILEERHADK